MYKITKKIIENKLYTIIKLNKATNNATEMIIGVCKEGGLPCKHYLSTDGGKTFTLQNGNDIYDYAITELQIPKTDNSLRHLRGIYTATKLLRPCLSAQ